MAPAPDLHLLEGVEHQDQRGPLPPRLAPDLPEPVGQGSHHVGEVVAAVELQDLGGALQVGAGADGLDGRELAGLGRAAAYSRRSWRAICSTRPSGSWGSLWARSKSM